MKKQIFAVTALGGVTVLLCSTMHLPKDYHPTFGPPEPLSGTSYVQAYGEASKEALKIMKLRQQHVDSGMYKLAKAFYIQHPAIDVSENNDSDADADIVVQGLINAYEATGRKFPRNVGRHIDSQGNFDHATQAAIDDFANFSKAFLDAYKYIKAGGPQPDTEDLGNGSSVTHW